MLEATAIYKVYSSTGMLETLEGKLTMECINYVGI
jgi:hypothetical protein